MKFVFLLKNKEVDDEFDNFVTNNQIIFINTFITHPKYYENVENLEKYSAFIFTSKRAVQYFCLKYKIQGKICFVVGKATAREVIKFGGNALGEDSGNSEELAKFILNAHKDEKNPLLFVCGVNHLNTLPSLLDGRVEKLIVYETIIDSTLYQNILKISDSSDNIVVFFSPRIVNSLGIIMKTHKNTLFIGIGKTTSKAIVENMGRECFTSPKASPESLFSLIETFD